MPKTSRAGGFTLIEMMVSVVIMGIVTTQIFLVLTIQNTTYMGQGRILEAQQDARLVTELMQVDIRTAGMLVPGIAAMTSRDGGTANPDVLCTSDPSVLGENEVTGASTFFDRATLSAALGAGLSTVQLTLASMDIDADGDNDFAVGQGIIISDGGDNHCARITGITAGAVSFDAATPAGFSAGLPGARAVPATIYQVTGAGLTRNGVVISEQVENIQVEFAVDTDDDGTIGAGEFPLHGLAGSDPSLVRRVRLSVITRTASEDPALEGAGMPPAGNHTGTAADGFLRRRYTASVFPRNL